MVKERKRVQKVFTDQSRTKQAFKRECDVNHIVKRFKVNLGVDFLDRYQGALGGHFGDFTQVCDYRSALDRVMRADEVFMALPAKVRSRFQNDPALFLEFVEDPKNAQELVELGLAVPKKAEPEAQKGAEKVPEKDGV